MNIGDLFDSPWKVLIVAVVVLVLFGSRKLPDAARSLGRSMRILKSEIQDLHEDDANGTQAAQAQPQAGAAAADHRACAQRAGDSRGSRCTPGRRAGAGGPAGHASRL